LTDGNGIPLGVAIDRANRNDMKLVEATLCQMVIGVDEPTEEAPQHLCLDKGYDYAAVRQTLAEWGCTVHIRRRGEEAQERAAIPGYRARRWVVERTHSWMNAFAGCSSAGRRRPTTTWHSSISPVLGLPGTPPTFSDRL
jgi:putative transposase